MTKVTESPFVITGKSGKEYKFDIYTLDTTFNKTGGVYIFTRRYQGTDSKYYHDFIYCGKTDDLSTRFDNHHKADCIKKNKANCICVKEVSTEKERTEIEEDILKGNNFLCNEVLN
jgi:predicted GIY-YIG superfamily endonuclease